MAKHLKILIGVPSGQHWLAQFGVDLGSLMVKFYMQRVPGYGSQELRVANVRSSILPKNRMDIMNLARKADVDYLLFLDSDHTFPSDLLHQLLIHELPVVAANCVTKQIPAQTTARHQLENDARGEPVYTDQKLHLEQVWRVGTGVMLIRKDVLQKIPNSAWAMKYLPEADTFQGEDWTFCQACEEAGIPIYVDHKVSREVGHIGNLTFTHDYVGEVA